MAQNEVAPIPEPEEQPSSTELTLRDILQRNQFKENDGLLDSEITELESLYAMSKGILLDEAQIATNSTQPKRIGTNEASKKKNMMFIATQTANLISIRKLKMDLVRQKADLKRDELDRSIKTLVQITKENKGGDDEGSPKRVLDFLINHLNIHLPNPYQPVQNEVDVDAALEAQLLQGAAPEHTKPAQQDIQDAILSDIGIYTDGEPDGADGYKTVYDEDGNILVYNSDEDKVYVVTPEYDLVRELSEGEYEAEMTEDGQLVDTVTGTIIEVLE